MAFEILKVAALPPPMDAPDPQRRGSFTTNLKKQKEAELSLMYRERCREGSAKLTS
jgi:hypothetical protein